jgi:hypothetical protein
MAPGRRAGPTLAERSALSGSAPPATTAGQGAGGGRPGGSGSLPRNCWVTDLPDVPGRFPGLLVEWSRRGGSGSWSARVVYGVRDGGQVVLIETWVPAEHLQPADG